MASPKRPNYFLSILQLKCPRCRRGHMYRNSIFFHWRLSKIFDMYERCPVCDQKFELETGFWFGTGYVSYALSVALSVATFVAYAVLLGITWRDNSIFYWLIANAIVLAICQPWIMRLSRTIYLYFFVYYDEELVAQLESK